MRVPEAAVVTQIQITELAEIMGVQFQQVGQDGLLIRRGGNEFDARK